MRTHTHLCLDCGMIEGTGYLTLQVCLTILREKVVQQIFSILHSLYPQDLWEFVLLPLKEPRQWQHQLDSRTDRLFHRTWVCFIKEFNLFGKILNFKIVLDIGRPAWTHLPDLIKCHFVLIKFHHSNAWSKKLWISQLDDSMFRNLLECANYEVRLNLILWPTQV